jgi:2-iminobutanoate/2-iminopropanoate deaminase
MPKRILHHASLGRPIGVFSQATMVDTPGRMIFVSGLVARGQDGAVVGRGDVRAQTRYILDNLKTILAEGGATLADVVKVTVFIRDMAHFAQIHEVRRDYFPESPPASTMVEVSRLTHDDLLIEIEAVAVVEQ